MDLFFQIVKMAHKTHFFFTHITIASPPLHSKRHKTTEHDIGQKRKKDTSTYDITTSMYNIHTSTHAELATKQYH